MLSLHFAKITLIILCFAITLGSTASTLALDLQASRTKTNSFSSEQQAMDYLSVLSGDVHAILNSKKIYIGRFSNSVNHVYCEPIASAFQNNLIAAFKSKKVFLVEAKPNVPMIIGEYKRRSTKKDLIMIRIKIGSFSIKNNKSIHNFISPWVSFPASELSKNKRTCLLQTKIGTAHLVRLSSGRQLLSGPWNDASAIRETDNKKIKLIGFTDEEDFRWWIFGEYDPISKQNQFFYANNIAQFVFDSKFNAASGSCDKSNKDNKSQNIMRSSRKLLKQGIINKITRYGFYNADELTAFGVNILKLCQETFGDVINFNVHYVFHESKPRELVASIDYKLHYGGKVEYFDISGELDSLSERVIRILKRKLING